MKPVFNLAIAKPGLFTLGLIFVFSFSLPFEGHSQKSSRIKLKDLEKLLADPADSLTVINFWATWCKPCVKEIPHFEATRKNLKNKSIRFWYISLDFADQQKTRLDPFVKAKMNGARVFLLDEVDYNQWLNKIDSGWEGSIPVTLFVNNSKKIKKFVGNELNEEQLNQIISSFL